MRIIAGKFKSRKLTFPRAKTTRPTMDRVKETLFNVLGDQISDAAVLDLFAGCGSLGFEALSRGARSALFVDSDTAAISCLNTNSAALGLTHAVRIIKSSVPAVLASFERDKRIFDIILMDPPYSADLAKKTLLKIYGFDILAPNGILVIEHAVHEKLPLAKHIEFITHKKFGQTQLSFLMAHPKEGIFRT
jgi:16S rRNA (guanine966-N2)-methyltransferase